MINVKENIEIFSYEVFLTNGKKIENNHVIPSFNMLINGDSLKISISIDDTDPVPFNISAEKDLEQIIELNDQIDTESETLIKIEIIKSKTDESINIYNLATFMTYLEQLTLKQLFTVFQRFSKSDDKVILYFKEFDANTIFSSNLFSTIKERKETENHIKKNKIENINFVANTSGITSINLIPEDFHVLQSTDNMEPLKNYFNKISTLLCIAFISDWSEFEDENLNIKIRGYKKIDYSISLSHDIHNQEIFFKIYQWIFESGNGSIEDKLGLARNIISRYIKFDNLILYLDEDAYSSLITSYKIYLKENVEKYIDTKNKVAELTTELSIKIRDMNHYIVNSFKNNNLTIIGYFITLFIFNSLSFKQSTIFTVHTFAISIIVLIVSRLYLLLTSLQINKDIEHNKNYFQSVKEIYKDIFDESELNKLFDMNYFESSSKEVKKTFRTYHNIWILEIYLILLVSIILTFSSSIKLAAEFYLNLIQ